MKFTILVAALFTFCTANVFASNGATRTSTTQKTINLNLDGLRVEVLTPLSMEVKVKAEKLGMTKSAKEDVDSGIGFSVGYAQLPIAELGFSTNVAYLQTSINDEDFNFARLEGNLGTSINPMLTLTGGLNLSKLTEGQGTAEDDVDKSGVGIQFCAGLQMNPNLAANLRYSAMNQSGSNNGKNFDMKERGFEIGLQGRF